MNFAGVELRVRSTTAPTYDTEHASVLNDLARGMTFDQFVAAVVSVVRDMPDLRDEVIEGFGNRLARIPGERARKDRL